MADESEYAVNPQNKPMPKTLFELLDHNADVKNLLVKDSKIPLSSVSRPFQKMFRPVNIHLSIPSAETPEAVEIPHEDLWLDHGKIYRKRQFLVKKLAYHKRQRDHKIVALNVHCDKEIIMDIIVTGYRLTTANQAASEVRYHYSNMRLISDFVCSLRTLTTVNLSHIVIDGIVMRILGDMLRQSVHLKTFSLSDVQYNADPHELSDIEYLDNSFTNITSLTLRNIDMEEYAYELVSPWDYLDHATNLTSLSMIGCTIDPYLFRDLMTCTKWDLTKLPYLQTVDVSNNEIDDIDDDNDNPPQPGLYQSLPLLTQITTLNLQNNTFTAAERNRLHNTIIGNTRLILN